MSQGQVAQLTAANEELHNSLLGKRQDGLYPIPSEEYGGLGIDGVHSLASHSPRSARVYLLVSSRDPAFRAHAIQNMTGTSGCQRAGAEALVPYPLPVPPADNWIEFGLTIARLFARVESNQRQSYTLAAQRDALLPRVVSGELQVGGPEASDGRLAK